MPEPTARRCCRSGSTCTIPWHAEVCKLYESGLSPRQVSALMDGKHGTIKVTPPRVSQVVTWHELPRHRRERTLADMKNVLGLVRGGLPVKLAAKRIGIAADPILYRRLRALGWTPGMHRSKQRGVVFACLCLGMSHAMIARQSGVSIATISRWRHQFGVFPSNKKPRRPATGGARGGFTE